MPARYTVTVTERRPQGTDRYGDPTGYTSPQQISGCIIAPSSGDSGQPASTERTDMRDTVITGWTLYAPFGVDIVATSEIQLPGDTTWWQVDGEVAPWQSPHSGWRPGTQVALRRVRG